jgi:hypothetical protein
LAQEAPAAALGHVGPGDGAAPAERALGAPEATVRLQPGRAQRPLPRPGLHQRDEQVGATLAEASREELAPQDLDERPHVRVGPVRREHRAI